MTKLFFILISCFVFNQVASASTTSCYQFQIENSAETTTNPSLGTQTWCYRQLASPTGAVLIYDSENLRPELSAVVDSDGTVTHGSLIKGKVTVHKVNSVNLNPLPVPLKQPLDRKALSIEKSIADETKIKEILRFFQRSRADLTELRIEEGVFTSVVPANSLPWRGYWWSFKNNSLWAGSNAPLAKYDRYAQGRTGLNPGVQAWEGAHHSYNGADWGGHCNGWAASALLRPEPNRTRFDQVSGQTFTIADQKGILAEEDFCARVSFYGRRNNGFPTDDPSDIYPAEFHNVLTYYVGQLNKVVAMDYVNTLMVDTHLISGYTLDIRRQSADTYLVTANLRVHKYDSSPNEPPGIAPTYTRTYQYTLRVNALGQLIGGTWLSENPDFLWVPLSPADCPANNPFMRADFVNEIMSLPAR